MFTFSLQTGSNGNCIYVEAGAVKLLFDAGISARQAHQRMQAHGRSMRNVTALILSHDHNDHVGCAGVFQRIWAFPIYATPLTHRAIAPQIGKVRSVCHFSAGQTLHFGDVQVHSLPTPHDAVDGSAFIVEHQGRRLGVMLDLGHAFPELRRVFPTLDAAYLESNYCPKMLASGSYPSHLKARIRGGNGHLSNEEAAELIFCCSSERLKWVALSHLSAENNSPRVALKAHQSMLGGVCPLHISGRDGASVALTV